MNRSILVVGGLAAGPSAASKAKRVNPDANVILFEQGEFVSYGICEVPYYVSGTVRDLEDLNPLEPAKLEATRGIKVKTEHRVEEILSSKKRLLVRDLNRDKVTEYSYDKLILATGSVSRSPGIEGENAKNVFRVKSLSDGIAIKKFVDEKKPRRCVIIGGGYVGMEFCEALVSRNMEVVLLHLDDYPMSGLEEETRKRVLSELTRNGVRFMAQQRDTRFLTDKDGGVRTVQSQSGSFDCDMVVLAVGVAPNTELAAQARINLGRHGGILTDERQSTNIDSVFAAGDCCEIKNLVSGRHMLIPLATYASRQGRVAGENAAGGRAVFKGGIRSIAVKIFNLEVAQVGISATEAEEAGFDVMKLEIVADTKVHYYPGNSDIAVVAIVDKKTHRMLGANVCGGEGSVLRANVLAVAIQQKLTISELSQLDLIYSPPFSPLWDPVLTLAHQLKKNLLASD